MANKHDKKNVYRAVIMGSHREVSEAIMKTMSDLKDNFYHGFDGNKTVWYTAKLDNGDLVMRHDIFMTPDDGIQAIVGHNYHEIATGGSVLNHPHWYEFEKELIARMYK